MNNVCHQCGLYRADKIIDPVGPYAICPECGYKHRFRMMPLFIVSGASGSGKTSVWQHMLGKCDDFVLLDSDILWSPAFDKPREGYREFFETWLSMSNNISQSGRPVVLFGAGVGVPENIEPRVERRYFSTVKYIALVCKPEVLVQRLQERPAWRNAGSPEFIQEQLRFNQWFQDYRGTPPICLIDTSSETIDLVSNRILELLHI